MVIFPILTKRGGMWYNIIRKEKGRHPVTETARREIAQGIPRRRGGNAKKQGEQIGAQPRGECVKSKKVASTNDTGHSTFRFSKKEVQSMSNEEIKVENKPRTDGGKRGIYFAFVAQLDESSQMEVVRWLQGDAHYRVCTIVHDHDTYSADDDLPDGRAVGDTKPAHIHGIVRVGSKITAGGMKKRFGGYLHFILLEDPAEYAEYMIHNTFRSRDKYKYSPDMVMDDVSLWQELRGTCFDEDCVQTVRRVKAYLHENLRGTIQGGLVDNVLAHNDAQALRSIMSHAYFYSKFL